jgi:SET domain-containing protein
MRVIKIPSYLNPKLIQKLCTKNGGYGIFALEHIDKNEVLTVWGGRIYNLEEFNQLDAQSKMHSIQVEEGLYLIADQEDHDPADYFNHSCDPNAWLEGQIVLTARREILPGEEVCFDYAMSDGSPYDEFECSCGSPICRGKITGNDWQNPELQMRYENHFSTYLQRRIVRAKLPA